MTYKHIHFIGIGGISQSALAYIVASNGYSVSGSDISENSLTKKLKTMGVKIYNNHKASNVYGSDLVVTSSAIKEDNPEIAEAHRLGIEVIYRAEMLSRIAKNYEKVISVAGTHGKTTTTGMISTIFIYAGKDPTIHIGGELPIINGNVKIGQSNYFITEACEYCDSFLYLNSYASIITNIQKDHMDYFKNMSNLQKSFKLFANNTKSDGFLIINGQDKNCKKIKSDCPIIDFGLTEDNMVYAKNISFNENDQYSYDLVVCDKELGRINLAVSGYHNIYNSLAAITVALCEDINIKVIIKALQNYKPSKRRFELITEINGAKIIHDYAHHPTEITTNIKSAKNMCKGKLYIVFEPHTFSRTQYLWKEFVNCFSGTDHLILTPIYPAREQPIKNITSENLATAIKNTGLSCEYIDNFNSVHKKLLRLITNDDIVLLLGAGTIEKMCDLFK